MLLAEKGSFLYRPPRKAVGARQFSADHVRITQYIAQKRIHIERAMRHVKQWSYLAHIQKMNQLDIVTNAFKAAAHLTNYIIPPLTAKGVGNFESTWIADREISSEKTTQDISDFAAALNQSLNLSEEAEGFEILIA